MNLSTRMNKCVGVWKRNNNSSDLYKHLKCVINSRGFKIKLRYFHKNLLYWNKFTKIWYLWSQHHIWFIIKFSEGSVYNNRNWPRRHRFTVSVSPSLSLSKESQDLDPSGSSTEERNRSVPPSSFHIENSEKIFPWLSKQEYWISRGTLGWRIMVM